MIFVESVLCDILVSTCLIISCFLSQYQCMYTNDRYLYQTTVKVDMSKI